MNKLSRVHLHVHIRPICCFFISSPASLAFREREAFQGHLLDLDFCLKMLPETDQGRKWVPISSAAESGAFSLTRSWGCTSAVWKTATRVEQHGDIFDFASGFALWTQCKLYTWVIFQKYFILILIQVQGNKRTRIYLTGHGNETVKVSFCWSTFFLDKDMQVNTGGGLQKSKQNVPYCRNAVRVGVSPHPSHCTDFTQQQSLFLIFNRLL